MIGSSILLVKPPKETVLSCDDVILLSVLPVLVLWGCELFGFTISPSPFLEAAGVLSFLLTSPFTSEEICEVVFSGAEVTMPLFSLLQPIKVKAKIKHESKTRISVINFFIIPTT